MKRGTNPSQKKNNGGRPPLYESIYAEQVYKLCWHRNMTDDELANAFGVSVSSIEKWTREQPEFKRAKKKGKDKADDKVVYSLFQRATGYSHPDIDIRVVDHELVITDIVKHYPPDTTACIFWLKNRQRENWKDVHRQEHTGAGGGPIKHIYEEVPMQDFDEAELQAMANAGIKIASSNPNSN